MENSIITITYIKAVTIQLGHDSIRFTIYSFRPIRLKFITQSANIEQNNDEQRT